MPTDQVIVRFEDDYYDLTNFVDRHPGGAKAISGLAGKNATLLIEHHHRNDVQVWKTLKAFRIDKEAVRKDIPELNAKDKSLLQLQRRWDQKGRLSPWEAFILLSVPAVMWVAGAAVFDHSSGMIAFSAMIVHALALVMVMTVSHELCHFQVFNNNHLNKVWNRWYVIVFLGIDGQALFYDHPVHHVYTNIAHLDSALETGPIVFHPELMPTWTPLRMMYQWTNRALLMLVFSPVHLLRVWSKTLASNLGVQHCPEWIRALLGPASQVQSFAKFGARWISPLVIMRTALLSYFLGFAFVLKTTALASFAGCILVAFSQHYDKPISSPADVTNDRSFMEHMCSVTEDFRVNAVASFLFFGNQDMHTRHHLLPNVHRWRFHELETELQPLLAAHGVCIQERTLLEMLVQTWTFFASGQFAIASSADVKVEDGAATNVAGEHEHTDAFSRTESDASRASTIPDCHWQSEEFD